MFMKLIEKLKQPEIYELVVHILTDRENYFRTWIFYDKQLFHLYQTEQHKLYEKITRLSLEKSYREFVASVVTTLNVEDLIDRLTRSFNKPEAEKFCQILASTLTAIEPVAQAYQRRINDIKKAIEDLSKCLNPIVMDILSNVARPQALSHFNLWLNDEKNKEILNLWRKGTKLFQTNLLQCKDFIFLVKQEENKMILGLKQNPIYELFKSQYLDNVEKHPTSVTRLMITELRKFIESIDPVITAWDLELQRLNEIGQMWKLDPKEHQMLREIKKEEKSVSSVIETKEVMDPIEPTSLTYKKEEEETKSVLPSYLPPILESKDTNGQVLVTLTDLSVSLSSGSRVVKAILKDSTDKTAHFGSPIGITPKNIRHENDETDKENIKPTDPDNRSTSLSSSRPSLSLGK